MSSSITASAISSVSPSHIPSNPASEPSNIVDLRPQLNELWARLGELTQLVRDTNREGLDQDDVSQLDDLERITAGYATTVMAFYEVDQQIGQGADPQPDLVPAFNDFAFLVRNHCIDSSHAIRMAMREQDGTIAKPVRIK